MISIDIGKKYLAFSYLNYEDDSTTFGFMNFKKSSVLKDKINHIVKHLEDFKNLKFIIVEQQFNNNVSCMCIMYAIITFAAVNRISYEIFKPSIKFTYFNIKYDSKNKNHKKLSVSMVKVVMKQTQKQNYKLFKKLDKQDDIADSFLMLIISANKLNKNNYNEEIELLNNYN